MKKLLVITVAALALAACTQEKNIVPADPGLTEITATHVSTRSALYASDGETLYNILWDAPDKILVGYAGSELATFTSKNESPAAEATFTGKLPEGSGELYGIYPAEDDNTVEADGSYKIIMHTVQTAVEGSYDPMAFPAIAQSESKNLSFMNVFGLLELTVGYEDVTSIFFGVKMSGNEVDPRPLTRKTAEPLSISVQMKDGEPLITSFNGQNETGGFVLNPPKGSECFKIDTPYYLAVHPVGGWLQGISPAFWLTHSDGSTTEIVFDSNPIIERSKVHPVKRLFLEDEPEVPEAEAIFLDGNKTISVGESITLVPTINPSNATPVLVWSSDDPETVSVTQEGVITGEKSGGTYVTVTVQGSDPDLQPDLTACIYVTVTPDDPDDPDSDNRISYDGGKTWKPLKQAAFYYSANYQGYEIIVLGDETAPYQTLTEAPSCDWFFLDIPESKLGTHQLPKDLSVFGEWFSYFSWKGAPKGSEWCGAIRANEVESGSLELDIDRDKDRIDLDFEAEFEGKSVIVVYHGSAIDSDKDFYHWEWKVTDNRISYDGGESWSELKSAGFYYDSVDDGYEFCFVSEEIDDFSEIMSEPEGGWLLFDIGGEKLGTQDLPDYLATSDWTCFFYWPGKRADDVDFDNGGGLSIDIDVDNMTVDFSMDAEFEGDHVIAVYSGTVIESSRKILRAEAWGVGY